MSGWWDAIEIDMGCFSDKKKRVIHCPHLAGLRQIHWIKKEIPDHKLDSCNLCKITKTHDRINDFLIVPVKKCPIFQPIWSEGQLSLLRNSLMEIMVNVGSCWMVSVDFCVWCKGTGGKGVELEDSSVPLPRGLLDDIYGSAVWISSVGILFQYDVPHNKTRVKLIHRILDYFQCWSFSHLEVLKERVLNFQGVLAQMLLCKMFQIVNVPWWKWYSRLIMEGLSTSFSKELLFSLEDPSLNYPLSQISH